MTSEQVLKQWMDIAGLPTEVYDQTRRICGFNFLNRFDIVVEAPPASEDIFISIDIIETAQLGDLNGIMIDCMKLNAYGLETRGASLGYDEAAKMIILSHRVNAHTLDGQGLSVIVNNLVGVAQSLQDRLKSLNEARKTVSRARGDAVIFS